MSNIFDSASTAVGARTHAAGYSDRPPPLPGTGPTRYRLGTAIDKVLSDELKGGRYAIFTAHGRSPATAARADLSSDNCRRLLSRPAALSRHGCPRLDSGARHRADDVRNTGTHIHRGMANALNLTPGRSRTPDREIHLSPSTTSEISPRSPTVPVFPSTLAGPEPTIGPRRVSSIQVGDQPGPMVAPVGDRRPDGLRSRCLGQRRTGRDGLCPLPLRVRPGC